MTLVKEFYTPTSNYLEQFLERFAIWLRILSRAQMIEVYHEPCSRFPNSELKSGFHSHVHDVYVKKCQSNLALYYATLSSRKVLTPLFPFGWPFVRDRSMPGYLVANFFQGLSVWKSFPS